MAVAATVPPRPSPAPIAVSCRAASQPPLASGPPRRFPAAAPSSFRNPPMPSSAIRPRRSHPPLPVPSSTIHPQRKKSASFWQHPTEVRSAMPRQERLPRSEAEKRQSYATVRLLLLRNVLPEESSPRRGCVPPFVVAKKGELFFSGWVREGAGSLPGAGSGGRGLSSGGFWGREPLPGQVLEVESLPGRVRGGRGGSYGGVGAGFRMGRIPGSRRVLGRGGFLGIGAPLPARALGLGERAGIPKAERSKEKARRGRGVLGRNCSCCPPAHPRSCQPAHVTSRVPSQPPPPRRARCLPGRVRPLP